MDKISVLAALPSVQGQRRMINPDQSVRDIMREVLEAHGYFAKDYKLIGPMFMGGSTEEVCRRLFDFCKKNIRYNIEGEEMQSTRSPGALLIIGSGDCKHYAGFIGGCLDAIGGFDWCYRFASYDLFHSEPGHVFVVVKDKGREIWVDPVLSGFDKRTPRYTFKKDKRPAMALHRIYGVAPVGSPARAMPPTSFVSRAVVRRANLLPAVRGVGAVKPFPSGGTLAEKIAWQYASGWAYFSKIYGPNLSTVDLPCTFLADGEPFDLPIQAHMLREQGKPFDYMPQGIQVKYPVVWQGQVVPLNMLRPIVTEDRRLLIQEGDNGEMFDFKGLGNGGTNKLLIANDNRLLNLLVSATGAIQMAYQPYPDAENLQRFYDSMLRLRNMDFFYPREIKTVAGSFIKGFEQTIAAVGRGILHVATIVPRTAFLLALKINLFNMAHNMWLNITNGKGSDSGPVVKESLRLKWKGIGGDMDGLLHAIDIGHDKKPIISGTQVVSGTMGEAISAAAIIAAATAVIALLANFIKATGDPKTDAMVDAAVGTMNGLLVASGYDPIAVSESLGGKPVLINNPGGGIITIPPNGSSSNGFITWVENNPMLAAGAAGGVALIAVAGAKKYRGRVRR